jgi:hypothetical protein
LVQTRPVAARSFTKPDAFVLKKLNGSVAKEIADGEVAEAIKSNNALTDVDQYVQLWGGDGTATETERALDYPGLQYMREWHQFGSGEGGEGLLIGWASVSTCHSYLLEKTLPIGALEWCHVGGRSGVVWWVREGKATELAERLYKESILKYKATKDLQKLEEASVWLSVSGKQQLLSALYKQHGLQLSDVKTGRVGEFLGLDFSKEENKNKAMKNAVELLRQKRYLLATAVFMLGDFIEEAVDVCCRCLNDRSRAVLILKAAIADVKKVASAERARLLLDKVLAEAEGSRWLTVANLWKHRDFAGILTVFRGIHEGICHLYFRYLVKQMRILDPTMDLTEFNAELARLRTVAARTLVKRRLGRVVETLPELNEALTSDQLRASIHNVY